MARGEKSLLCDPRSELRLGGREKKGEDNKWDGKNKQKDDTRCQGYCSTTIFRN